MAEMLSNMTWLFCRCTDALYGGFLWATFVWLQLDVCFVWFGIILLSLKYLMSNDWLQKSVCMSRILFCSCLICEVCTTAVYWQAKSPCSITYVSVLQRSLGAIHKKGFKIYFRFPKVFDWSRPKKEVRSTWFMHCCKCVGWDGWYTIETTNQLVGFEFWKLRFSIHIELRMKHFYIPSWLLTD